MILGAVGRAATPSIPGRREISALVFETTRLVVRHLRASDFDAFHEMQSDDEVMRYTTGAGLAADENRRQFNDCIAKYSDPDNDFWVWAIVRKSDQEFVGTCAIVPNHQRPEIGYRFRRQFFGHGYGQEICNGLIDFGIFELNLTEIVAYADVRNAASRKILDRSRMAFIKEIHNEDGVIDRFYHWTRQSST
ncbi:MAG: GNAT family N-acetyltransferase [Pseudomonadota bacterium]